MNLEERLAQVTQLAESSAELKGMAGHTSSLSQSVEPSEYWTKDLVSVVQKACEVESSLGPVSRELIEAYLDDVTPHVRQLVGKTIDTIRNYGVASSETLQRAADIRNKAVENIEKSAQRYRVPVVLFLDAAHVAATRDGSIPVAQLEKAATDYKALSGQLTAALGSLKLASENAAAGQAIGDFASRATAHKNAAIVWCVLTAIAGALTVYSVYFVLNLSPKTDTTREIAAYVLHSVLVVALATVALRIAIRR